MPAPTATIVIGTIGTQTANTPFAIAGTYALSSTTWSEQLSYEDDTGALIPINTAPISLQQVAFSFIHPGLAAGTHTVSVKDPYTGAVIQSNLFTVTGSATIVSNVPTGVVAGQPYTFTGTLTGFATAPALTYRLDGGASTPLTGVTTSGWSMVLTAPAAGSHTLLVVDGAVSAAPITFTVQPVSVNHVITPAVPAGVIAGATFTFTGTLGGYTTARALTLQINTGAKISMTGVTATGWSMTLTAPTTPATYTFTVSDGTAQASIQVVVAAQPKTITPYAPPSTQAGKLVTFTGVLNNYTTIPALTLQIGTAAAIPMTGVSVTGWSMAITAPATAGSYTLTVSDGTISGQTTLTVTAATAATRRYQDQPGTNANVWNTPIGNGATYGLSTDADTIAARHGGTVNITTNYGAVFWDATAQTTNTSVSFTGHGGDYANPLYVGTGQPFAITASCIIGSYSPGPYPADNQYAFTDEVNHPGKYIEFGPLAIQNLQPGLPTQAAYFGGIEDAMSDTFAQDWETGHANFSQTAGIIRGYDVDPTRNQARIPGTSLTRIQHVLRYAHDPLYVKSNANSNTTVNPDYPNGFLNANAWPQLYQDYQANNNIYTGNLLYGTQLFIPMSTPFPTSLVGNTAAQQLFDCLQRYGSITRDVASGGYTLFADQNVPSSWSSQAIAAMPTLVQLLVPMRNQHQGGQSFATYPINGPGTRLDSGPPPLAPIGGPTATAVTWNSSDIGGSVTLDSTGYIATSGGTATAGSTPQGVRASSAISTTAIVAWEVTMTALTQNWAAGVADKTYSLTNSAGIGFDTHAMGAYPSTGTGSQPAQTVYYNNAQLTAGNGVADTAGDVMSIVVNGTNFFFSTPSMRTTSGVNWNNSSTATPVTNVGGLSFSSMATTHYPVFSEGESGGKATLNDGSKAFSPFMTLFLNQNSSVVTLSGQVTTSGPQIQANTPANVVSGSPFTFNGSISDYASIPTLTYRVNNGTTHPLTGVTLSGWSMTLTITATGSTTITVSDGTISNVVTFTVTTGGTGVSRVVAPLTGTVTTGTTAKNSAGVFTAWTAVDLTVTGVTLASSKKFHFEILPPANYSSTYTYPVLLWLHPDTEGDPWYNGGNTNPNYLSAYDADGWFNTVSFRTNYPCFVVVAYADQTAAGIGDGNDAVENWGGWVNSGTTGSGTVYSGDTGPNVFALVNGVIPYMEGNYSIDSTRLYSMGFSLGAIGTEYLMLKYNMVNGLQKLFAAGVSCGGGVLEINGMGSGPTTADVTATQSPPIWNISGQNDGTSIPADWNLPVWTAITGNTNYPTAITTASASRAGTSNYYLSYLPNVGHQQTDASGNPFATNSVILGWLFSQISGSAAAVSITGVKFTQASTLAANSAVGTIAGSLAASASGGTLNGVSYALNDTTNFAVSGSNLVFNNASVASGSYPLTVTVSSTNASNTPQSYPISVNFNFYVSSGSIYDPTGNLYIAKGVNILSNSTGTTIYVTDSTLKPLVTLFPGVNHIRLPVYPANPNLASAIYPTPDTFLTLAENLTGYNRDPNTGAWSQSSTNTNRVVLEIEDHNQDTVSGTYNALPPYSGQGLSIQLAWYNAMAKYYAGNPYVWLGGPNEITTADSSYNPSSIAPISTWEAQIYNAIRGIGSDPVTGNPNPATNNTSMIQFMAGVGGSDVGTVGVGSGFISSLYATMTNICWEIHCYYTHGDSISGSYTTVSGYVTGGTSAPNSGGQGGWGIIGAQTIQSADGVVPVIIGEWGSDSGEASGLDWGDITNEIIAVQTSYNTGATAWALQDSPGPSWNLTQVNSSGVEILTGAGTLVATAI